MQLNHFFLLGLATTVLALSTSNSICPQVGEPFPVPTSLSSNAKFQGATQSFENTIKASLKTGTTKYAPSPFNETTFSIGIFNVHDPGLLYQFHYTDNHTVNSGYGVRSVDADTVYRMGSIGKVLTVYQMLIRLGDKYWNEVITEYVPELSQNTSSPGTSAENGLPNWSQITIGQLASQMSGIAQDFIGDLAYPWERPEGLPFIPANDIPPCNYLDSQGSFKACDQKTMINYILAQSAINVPGYAPSYSNNAFILVALAMEKITGMTLEQLFNKDLVEALGLQGTALLAGNTTRGAIPGTPESTGWQDNLGLFSAAGGAFTTTNDVATLFRSILNGTLVSKSQIRRWMKPVSFTSDLGMSIGAPWEIFRVPFGGRILDLYAKNGGYGAYSTEVILVPGFDFGFSILSASALNETKTNKMMYIIMDMITDTVLKELETIAADQAREVYAGKFVASDGSNSSVTISVDNQPGLRATQWISNGTDVLQMLANSTSEQLDFRLQPNLLYTGDLVGFSGIWGTLPNPLYPGPLGLNCLNSWGVAGETMYGNVNIGDFVFEVDQKKGKAQKLDIKAFRITLEREVER